MRMDCRVLAVLVVLAAAAGGCNSENVPGLGRVTGTVKLDGKPVPNAAISFEPVDGSAGTAVGRTDANGVYELYYSRGNKGAKVGENIVRISNFQEAGESTPGQKETIPARYNIKSDLKVVVKSGQNTHDFDLKSGGEIIQPNTEGSAAGGRGGNAPRGPAGCF